MLNGGPQLCLLPSNAVHLFWLLPSLATMQRCEKTVSQSFTLRYELVNKHGLSEALCLLPLKATVRFLLRHSAGLFSDQFINHWCHQRGLSFASGRMGFVAAVGSSIQRVAFNWSPSRWAFAYQCIYQQRSLAVKFAQAHSILLQMTINISFRANYMV